MASKTPKPLDLVFTSLGPFWGGRTDTSQLAWAGRTGANVGVAKKWACLCLGTFKMGGVLTFTPPFQPPLKGGGEWSLVDG